MKSLRVLILDGFDRDLPNELIQLFNCYELEQLNELKLIHLGCNYNVAQAIGSCVHVRNLEKLLVWSDVTRSGVCKIASNPCLGNLKEFSIFNSIDVEECQAIADNLKHLQKIELSNINPNAFKTMTHLKHVKKINLRYGSINIRDLGTENFSNLETLILRYLSFDPSQLKILGTSPHLKNLTSILISESMGKLNGLTLEDLNEMFSGHLSTNLKYLTLWINLPKNTLQPIANKLKNLTYLSIGKLRENEVNDNSVKLFVENLKSESLLKHLEFVGSQLTDRVVEHLSGCFYLSRIETLSLKGGHYTLQTLDHVANSYFSNHIKDFKVQIENVEQPNEIERKINNWKLNGKLLKLVGFPKSKKKSELTTVAKRENPTDHTGPQQQTITKFFKKKKQE